MENIKQARYGIIGNSMFGMRIVAGRVTGIQYTEDKPKYELSFGKNKYWCDAIAKDKLELVELMDLASLEKVNETHGLKIKYGQQIKIKRSYIVF